VGHEGTIVAERFELESLAGRGGMGSVYRARDRATGGAAAVKILRDETTAEHRERFAREAQLMSELTHPGFVRCLGFCSEGETPYLAMEWLDGEDLAQRLAREPLSGDASMRLITRVAAALGAAHARGVVHRDIKPSNLFLVGGDVERAKVLDFGIAHVRRGGLAMTRTGATIGTPRYMAPEQTRGARDVDARSDVFSLGCVLFECLTGQPPFIGDNPIAVMMKILLEEAPRISTLCTGIPSALDDLVARMLAKEPSARPSDGLVIAAELEQIGPFERSGPPAARLRDSAVTVGEQRLVSVVLAATMEQKPSAPPLETAPTIASDEQSPLEGANLAKEIGTKLAATVAEYRGRSAVLSDGTIAVTIAGQGAATDQAARAARCALAIRELLPSAAMAFAIGRSVTIDRAVGEVIDRAAALLRVPAPERDGIRPIRVDEIAAGLLDVRFAIHGDTSGLVLVRERDVTDTKRTLLGKPTPCVGRERELGTLAAMYAECVDEPRSHIVVVTGPAGVGKSRLRHELLARLTKENEPRPQIWIARGDPLSAGAPFAMLAQLLRRVAGIVDDEPLAVRHRKLKARVSRNVVADPARVTEFLGELVGAPSRDEPSVQLRAARQDPQLMGDQMLRAWEELVAAESSVTPVVIVLEDLHWGDVPSVRAIDSIIRQLPERPVFVLALARPEVDTVFPRLWHERSAERIQLGELTRRAAEKLVREALGPVDTDTLGRLVERAAGNAFYLEELIRSVAEGHGDRLPETVVAMAQARIEGLEFAARQVLRAASIFGQAFWPGGIAALVDRSVEVGPWLDQLVERELVSASRESRLGDEREYRFRHALMREAAYAMLTERDRTRGHLHAGEWLESRLAADGTLGHGTAAEAIVLAEHFERGGDPRRASGWYQRAAEHALEGDDLGTAIDCADRAVTALERSDVDAVPDRRERVGLLRQLQSGAHIWRGDYPLAAARGREALAHLPPASTHWLNAAATVTDACCRQLLHREVVELCRALVAIPVAPALHGAYAHAIAMTMPTVLWHCDEDIEPALFARLDEIEAAFDRSDPVALGWICCARSWRALRDGDLGECHALDSMIVDCFNSVGDLRHACQQRAYVGYDELILGAFARAERSLNEAIAVAERMGLHQVTAHAQHNLGLVLARLGRLDEARTVEVAAISALDAQGNRRLALTARNYLALIEIDAGNFVPALRIVTEAIANGGDMESALSPYHATASTACRLAGDAAGAMAHASRALELVRIHGRPEEGDVAIRLAHAHALHASGAVEDAARVIGNAHDQLLEAGAKIRDATWRQSFLEAVPENAETIALARAWTK
jgi:eukaryotic-like serine/threonine-protein kinase